MPNSQKVHVPLRERIKSIPEIFGIRVNEEPEYETLGEDGDKQIRLYQPQVLASTVIENSSDEARARAFQRLAAYIFGQNKEKQRLAMTSPVIGSQEEHGWVMSFILPKETRYETAPSPFDRTVTLTQTSAQLWATLRFTGNFDNRLMNEKALELQMWVAAQSGYRAASSHSFLRWAQYDPPFSIPFFKRNEVQIQVQAIH